MLKLLFIGLSIAIRYLPDLQESAKTMALVNIQGFSQRFKNQTDSIKTLFADKSVKPEMLHQFVES